MEKITSIQNKYVREVRELSRKARARRQSGFFVAEGERLFREIPPELIAEVFLADSFSGTLPEDAGKYEKQAFHTFICAADATQMGLNACGIKSKHAKARLFRVSDSIMEAMSDTKTSQGILAVCRMKEEGLPAGSLYLVLENIQDPGNLGTIFRSAEAAGADGIILNRGCVDPYSPKVVRSTMGSLFRVPFLRVSEISDAIERVKEEGARVLAADLGADESVYRHDLRKPSAFLIGNEANGLSPEALRLADSRMRIPMKGKIDSLNAASAATILLFEALRQRL